MSFLYCWLTISTKKLSACHASLAWARVDSLRRQLNRHWPYACFVIRNQQKEQRKAKPPFVILLRPNERIPGILAGLAFSQRRLENLNHENPQLNRFEWVECIGAVCGFPATDSIPNIESSKGSVFRSNQTTKVQSRQIQPTNIHAVSSCNRRRRRRRRRQMKRWSARLLRLLFHCAPGRNAHTLIRNVYRWIAQSSNLSNRWIARIVEADRQTWPHV